MYPKYVFVFVIILTNYSRTFQAKSKTDTLQKSKNFSNFSQNLFTVYFNKCSYKVLKIFFKKFLFNICAPAWGIGYNEGVNDFESKRREF